MGYIETCSEPILSLETKLSRVPLAQHEFPKTDFLLTLVRPNAPHRFLQLDNNLPEPPFPVSYKFSINQIPKDEDLNEDQQQSQENATSTDTSSDGQFVPANPSEPDTSFAPILSQDEPSVSATQDSAIGSTDDFPAIELVFDDIPQTTEKPK